MMRRWMIAGAALALAIPVGANAEDTASCGKDQVCASNPQSIVDALTAGKRKATLGKDSTGDPEVDVDSSLDGYNYSIYFYGCVNHRNCDSIQFQVAFAKTDANTAELANKWNSRHRFLTLSVNDKGVLLGSMDVSTMNGLSNANFADQIDWWASSLQVLNKFFQKETPQDM